MSCGLLGWFVELRKEQPGIFCLLVTSILFITSLLGAALPGLLILYTLMMTIALGPGLGLYVIPSSWFHFFTDLLRAGVGAGPPLPNKTPLEEDLSEPPPSSSRKSSKVKRSSTSSSSRGSSEMRFVPSHFNGKSSDENDLGDNDDGDKDDDEDDYEIVTESDLNYDESQERKLLLESDL